MPLISMIVFIKFIITDVHSFDDIISLSNEREVNKMTYNQQLDGTERIIIHKVDDEFMVAGITKVYYSPVKNQTFRIIEDKYPLNKETLPILIEELKEILDN